MRTDLTEKAERFATASIAEYWVLDLNGRKLHVLRDPEPMPKGLCGTAYKMHTILTPTERVSPLAVPNASIFISDLLP